MKKISVLIAMSAISFASMFPAYIDNQNKMHRGDMTIEDSSKIKEFGLYQSGNNPKIYKMKVKVSNPCFIIEPSDWISYKKISPFEVELVQRDEDTFVGFSGTKHGGLVFNDDLPPNPKWLLGEKGCNEAPNYIEITAYSNSGNGWRLEGKGKFYILK